MYCRVTKYSCETCVMSGNSKLGRLHNVSLPPLVTCAHDVPCAEKCYAMKAFKQYPSVRSAWINNYLHYQDNPDQYFADIASTLEGQKYFRWHTAGDIPNYDYLRRMVSLAEKFPNIRFLAFTKRYGMVNALKELPENLVVYFSVWDGYSPKENKHNCPTAAYGYYPGAFRCKGDCSRCKVCFGGAVDTFFDPH